ncbi:MAG: hypothetical protein CFE24_13000 [Flavobacterium sp. BFFFF2]|nr:MAG: hypothetical protein CFE24_13000 [Flavobacterium sp. BFFFF2]
MKRKIINLFNNTPVVQNKGVKYAALLEQFITPFTSDFLDVAFYEDIFEFAINAWNLANMKLILPEGEGDAAINAENEQDINVDLLKRMIGYKISHFSNYTNFIIDFEIKETCGDPVLSVVTLAQEVFLVNMIEKLSE